MEGLEHVRAIAWDFDGVLNIADKAWRDAVREIGADPDALTRAIFGSGQRELLTGAEDVLDRLDVWVREAGFEGDPEDVLELLFEHDNDPDRDLLRMMAQLDQAGLVQVIATNSDPRRARFLAVEGGWADRVDALFASGEIGAMKPDAAFFAHIEAAMEIQPQELLLIDDAERNVDAADTRGWVTWHYQKGGAMALAQALMPLLLRGAQD